VIAVLLFFAFMVTISRFQPRLDDEGPLQESESAGDPLMDPQMIRLRSEVDQVTGQFAARQGAGDITLEDIELLEKAIESQRKVIQSRESEIATRNDLERLEELLSLYDEEMGSFIIAQSERLEAEAEQLWNGENHAEALAKLEDARNMQVEVNEQYPRSSARNPTRLHMLNSLMLRWQTEPMAMKADRLKAQAFELASDKQYEEAILAIEEAFETQQSINNLYRSSRYASGELLARAKEALASGNPQEAVAMAESASPIQTGIIRSYGGENEQLSATLMEIETLKATAASRPAYNQIIALRTAAREALLERDVATFTTIVSQWLRETQNFQRSFQKSEYAAQINDQEVTFLHGKREEIPGILEIVDGGLVPVPGYNSFMMLRTEVPQLLYSSVTGTNPSNLKNPQNPVESVTWLEAVEFTRLMSWILARPVALPSRQMFLNALGEVDQATVPATSWSRETTERATRPVGSLSPNTHQFHDLLGNVSEWLGADSDGLPEQVVAIGGAVRDSVYRIASVPEESRDPDERNRFIGFRFTVRMD
jgi:formylglycine-generating enzyme required for sulfatase activity